LPRYGARIVVCVDDFANVAELSAAAEKHGKSLECFVGIDCGAGRCGVNTPAEVLAIARAIDAAPGLKFTGIQAYQGAMQHLERYEDRKAKLDAAVAQVKEAVEALKKEGLEPEIVSRGGTGSYYFESCSGVYNELQCGSYAFMDDYGRVLDEHGKRIDRGEWENALFILTSVMSHAKPDKAICDAGLQAQAVDSGLPFVYGRDDVKYVKCSDEHGIIDDPKGVLKINEKLRLVPGHCDPTCNLHDWYVGIRKARSRRFGRYPHAARHTKARPTGVADAAPIRGERVVAMINPATFILMIIVGTSPPRQRGEYPSYHHCYEAAQSAIKNLGLDVRWDCVLKHKGVEPEK